MNAAPYCLNKIIQFFECRECGAPTWGVFGWVFALFFVQCLESLSSQTALVRGRRLYMHTFSICNSQIFAKSLRRKDLGSSHSSSKNESGEEKDEAEGGDNKSESDDGDDNNEASLNISSKSCSEHILFNKEW